MNEPRWDITNFSDPAKRFYLSYHDNSHYASVESLNQLCDLNKQNITLPSNQNIKKQSKNSSNKQATINGNNQMTKDEELVSAATGIDDLNLIRDTIETFGGDMDSVYNYLFSLLETNKPSEISSLHSEVSNESESKKEENVKQSTKY